MINDIFKWCWSIVCATFAGSMGFRKERGGLKYYLEAIESKFRGWFKKRGCGLLYLNITKKENFISANEFQFEHLDLL